MSSQAQHRQTGPVSPPPPAKRHTPRAGSHTACSDPTPPATGRHPSHSANLVKQQHRASQWSRTAAQIPRYPPPTASDHQRPAAGSAPSFCTAAAAPVASFSARRSPPPSDPSWGRTDSWWTVLLGATARSPGRAGLLRQRGTNGYAVEGSKSVKHAPAAQTSE